MVIYLTVGRYLPQAATATIDVFLVSDDSAVTLTSDDMTASNIGIFTWSTSNITAQPTARTEYYYTITPDVGDVVQGKFTLNGYSDILEIKRLLRSANNAVKIGAISELTENTEYDISEDEVSQFINEADNYIDGKLAGLYSTPLALSNAVVTAVIKQTATLLAGYYILSALHPNVSKGDVSATVAGWKKQADEILKDITSNKLILTGETLATGSPLSNYPMFGKPETIFNEVGISETSDVQEDEDILTN